MASSFWMWATAFRSTIAFESVARELGRTARREAKPVLIDLFVSGLWWERLTLSVSARIADVPSFGSEEQHHQDWVQSPDSKVLVRFHTARNFVAAAVVAAACSMPSLPSAS
jgi:hypothetical protein